MKLKIFLIKIILLLDVSASFTGKAGKIFKNLKKKIKQSIKNGEENNLKKILSCSKSFINIPRENTDKFFREVYKFLLLL